MKRRMAKSAMPKIDRNPDQQEKQQQQQVPHPNGKDPVTHDSHKSASLSDDLKGHDRKEKR